MIRICLIQAHELLHTKVCTLACAVADPDAEVCVHLYEIRQGGPKFELSLAGKLTITSRMLHQSKKRIVRRLVRFWESQKRREFSASFIQISTHGHTYPLKPQTNVHRSRSIQSIAMLVIGSHLMFVVTEIPDTNVLLSSSNQILSFCVRLSITDFVMSHNFNANTVIDGKVTVPLDPSGLLGRDIFKKYIIEKQKAFNEIHKLLECEVEEERNDEMVQFEADPFIDNQFCMTQSKKKQTVKPFKGLAAAIALQEQMGFQISYRPYNMNINDEGGTDSLEDANQELLGILQNHSLNEPKNSQAESKELNTMELESLLKEAYEAYHLEHWGPASMKYKTAWKIITDATFESQVKHIDKDVVCYMLCITLLETEEPTNLSTSMELLLNLEPLGHLFPAIYYALSKAHHKYYRFALALKAVERGFAALDSGIELTEHTIPGSTVVLPESTRVNLSASLAAMYDECSRWHPPDAICSMNECVPATRWYGPNQDIYFSDPTFNGMVIVTCSNTRHPCTMKFHQACWKVKKDQLSAVTKLPDKDIIGYECFTPSCETDQNSPSLIIKVEIYGDDGKLKTQIVAPANPVPRAKQRLQLKGAIPKQPVKAKRLPEKMRCPIPTAVPRSSSKEYPAEDCTEKVWRLRKLAKLRQNNFGIMSINEWRPDVEMYGNPRMMEIGFMLEAPFYDKDCHKQLEINTSIFTYFYEFIKENGCVTRNEISSKWEEDKILFNNYHTDLDDETDICEFLLQSYQFASVGPYIGIAEVLPELYRLVKSEVCGCLKFLLAGPANRQTVPFNDDIFNSIIRDYDEEQIKTGVVQSSKEPKMIENINSVPVTPPILSVSDSLRPQDIKIRTTLLEPKQSRPVGTGSNHSQEMQRNGKSEIVKSGLGIESKRSETTLKTTLNLPQETPPEMDPFAKENMTTHINDQHQELGPINRQKNISNEDSGIEKSLVELQVASTDIISEFRAVKPVENNIHAKSASIASLDESNVEKIETDLEKALALMKSALDQLKVRSENHAKSLQQEFDKYKLLSEQRLSELLKDSNRLEALCAKYETEKSNLMCELNKLQLDSSFASEENVALKLRNTEVMHHHSKLTEAKKKVEHDFDVLLRENALIKENLEMLRRDKEEMEKKLDKYRIRLKEKIDAEIKTSLEKEQKRLEEAKLSERKSQLQSLNQEFWRASLTFEKAVEKCHDNLHMLNVVGKIVTSLTGEQFTLVDARVAWQRCEHHLRLTATKYKDDYTKLKTLLESNQQIENLEHIKLPSLNIVFPKPLTFSEDFCEGQAKFFLHPTNVPPNLRSMQEALSANSCSNHMPANPYYGNTYFNSSVNSLHSIPYQTGSFDNRSSWLHTDPTDSPIYNTSVGINMAQLNQTIQCNSVPEKVHQKSTNDITNHSFIEHGSVIHQFDQIDISTNPPYDSQNSEAEDIQSNYLSYNPMNEINQNNGQISQGNDTSIVVDMTSVDGAAQFSTDRRAVLKTVGIDLLIQELKKKFVGVPEFDLVESVMDVRKLYNNTLSGMRVAEIIRESEPFIRQRQVKHYMRAQQAIRSEGLQVSPNRRSEPNSRSSTAPEQPRNMKKLLQNKTKKLVNSSTKVAQVAPIIKKPAWRPVTSGLINWVKNEEDSECIICFENMNALDEKAPVYALPCQHSFHHACIKKWLGEVSVCPICKMHCTMDDEFPPLPL
ncbi:uncharacterized protein LOC105688581 isoform X2 [Athalia rosae]|uniref:uncharacterized protein LOC105688581 isoform X2 n=1 Tax=Athalia rosae TaxID=37344 RepID=UPI00203377A7|nr:uncharacterized protein LOC105688581 isoform X2 [Athalia rosae]